MWLVVLFSFVSVPRFEQNQGSGIEDVQLPIATRMRGLERELHSYFEVALEPSSFWFFGSFFPQVHDAREPVARSGRNVSAKGRIKNKIQRISVAMEKRRVVLCPVVFQL